MTPSEAQPRAHHWQEAVIERIAPQTPRITSIFLRAPLAGHVAGQHVDVRLTAPDGYQAQRSYSIASAPGSATFELAIERLDDGEVSPYFHDIAQPGDTIDIRGPLGGHFVWRIEDDGPLLLIGGGSGIVPMMAIVRTWAAERSATPVLLVASARSWDDALFRDELLALETSAANFKFVVTTTRGPRHRDRDFDRRLDQSLLHDILIQWGETARHAYVCGSTAFVEAVASGLVADSMPAAVIRTERYGG